MKISIIVAIAENYAIGKDNKLLWHLSGDLKRFKELTNGKVVIMGQKTYESLPIRPLPNRINIVLTDNHEITFEGCVMAYDIEDALNKALNLSSEDSEVFIIGGGSIYRQFFDIADRLYITKVHEEFDADTFFPFIEEDKWWLLTEEYRVKDNKNPYNYSFLTYKKII